VGAFKQFYLTTTWIINAKHEAFAENMQPSAIISSEVQTKNDPSNEHQSRITYTGDLEQMPELSLSFILHLHHCVVGILDALQRFLNSWKQDNDLLFADQDLTVKERKSKVLRDSGGISRSKSKSNSEVPVPRRDDAVKIKLWPYLRWVYRSLRTLSWFWTVWMMAFTISELSQLTSESGTGRKASNKHS